MISINTANTKKASRSLFLLFFSNFYGSAIINCARIISKDRLNRCLIDAETNKWFLHNTNGIETLTCLPFEGAKKRIDDNYFTATLGNLNTQGII